MFRFGFGKEDITPKRGIPLCGYFEPRPNKGALDPLTVKAALFECNGTVTGIVSYDLCLMGRAMMDKILAAIKQDGLDFTDNLILCTTHTHTGPYTSALFGGGTDEKYIESLIRKSVSAVRTAFESLSDAELYTGKSSCSTLAFNRRFWMKDGTVLTNPGKLNPNIVKPEGTIDPEIPLFAVKQDGRLALLVANISNHTDTIGGDMVSADWPGRMEREIQNQIGYDLPVIMFLGCQGNINHFNVENDVDQTNYKEACRIGKGYAAEILSQLYALKKIDVPAIRVDSCEVECPAVQITDKEYEDAEAVVEKYSSATAQTADDLTSEGIAKGNAYVLCFFAKRVMACRDNPMQGKRIEVMRSIKIGNELGIVTFPGEPFIETQFAVKAASPFKTTMVGALGMGSIGYIGMPDSYGRGGGYETRPSPTAPAHDLAPKLIDAAIRLLQK